MICDRLLAGYSTNYVFGNTEVLYSAVKLDPAQLRNYTSCALFHRMNEFYLSEHGVSHVSDGFRAIRHDTQLQPFLERTVGFEKAYMRVAACYPVPYRVLVRATYPFRGVIARLDGPGAGELRARARGSRRPDAVLA